MILKNLVRFLLLLCNVPVVMAQMPGQVIFTGSITAQPGTQVSIQLVNCGQFHPRAIFQGAYVKTQVQTTFRLTLASDGTFSQALWPNDAIDCGGTVNRTGYTLTYIQNGVPVGQTETFLVPSTINPFDTTVQPPVSSLPPPNMVGQDFHFRSLVLDNSVQGSIGNFNTLNIGNLTISRLPPLCPQSEAAVGFDQNLGPICVPQVNYSGGDFKGIISASNMISKTPRVDVTHPDFGPNTCANAADPNGLRDSTCAISAAVAFSNASVPLNGGPACTYLPHGIYRISSSINLPSGACFVGDGPNTSILQLGDGNENGITITNHATVGITYARTLLSDFAIVGDGKNTTGTMIETVGVIEVDMQNIHLLNHGGRGINAQNDSERNNAQNVTISHVRMPIVNWGGNESYYQSDNIEDPGQDNNGFCWGINCVNGVYPAGGVIRPDHHAAVNLFADNIHFYNSSVKSTQQLSGIMISGNNGKVDNVYSEGFPFGGQPRINASIIVGQEVENFTLSGAISGTSTVFPLVDVSWATQYVNDPANLWANAQVFYDIHCADANPSSTALCAGSATLHQNDFERVSIIGFTGDKNVHIFNRCTGHGTNAICTTGSNVGVAWPANAVMSTVPVPGNGTVTIQDNHLISDETGGSGAYSSNCDPTTFNVCGEIIVGVDPDGIEVAQPGVNLAFAGKATSFSYQAFIMNNGFRQYVFNNGNPDYVHGVGIVKIPGAGTLQNFGLTNSTLTPFVTTGIPNQIAFRQFAVEFTKYPNGSASGFYSDVATHTMMSPDQNYFVSDYRSDIGSIPGLGMIFSNSYCTYDLEFLNRVCDMGGPDNSGGIEFDQLINGAWKAVFSAGSDGISTNPSEGPQMGQQQQLISNSSNLLSTVNPGGWIPLVAGNEPVVTGGIDDPFGGTNAFQIVFGNGSGSAILTNSNGTLNSGSTTVVSGMWIRACTGTVPVVWGFKDTGGNLPTAAADTVTTNWVQYSHQATSSFAYPYVPQFVIGESTAPNSCIQVYDPQANQGASLSLYFATSGSALLTPQSYVNVQTVYQNGLPIANSPLTGQTGSIGGGPLAAGACASGTAAVSNIPVGSTVKVGPTTPPGDGFTWNGYVATAGTVTVKVCALIAGTPAATTFNVSN